jgi:hypothetical protein
MTHIGLDKHLIEQSVDGQLDNSNILNDNNSKEIEEINHNNKEIRAGKEKESRSITVHPSHPSPIEERTSGSSIPSSDKDQQPSTSYSIVPPSEEVPPLQQPQRQGQEQQQHKKFNCFYYSQIYSSDMERVKHIAIEHPEKMFWPTPEDLESSIMIRYIA